MEIDTTKPNSARIYDYFLDGTHNYPVDRAVADQLLAQMPEIKQGTLLFRYFLHRAVRHLAQSGFTCYLDLATGLPTEGYVHDLVPETAKIVYNDIDPETILYARQILGDRPNILCMQADLRDIDSILLRANQFFQGERLIGICLVNVSYFLTDAELSYVTQRLYEWSAPGSQLAISALPPARDPRQKAVLEFYRSVGTPLYIRTQDELLNLVKPWSLVGEMKPIESYAEETLKTSAVPNDGVRGDIGYGGILTR
jgi:transposase